MEMASGPSAWHRSVLATGIYFASGMTCSPLGSAVSIVRACRERILDTSRLRLTGCHIAALLFLFQLEPGTCGRLVGTYGRRGRILFAGYAMVGRLSSLKLSGLISLTFCSPRRPLLKQKDEDVLRCSVLDQATTRRCSAYLAVASTVFDANFIEPPAVRFFCCTGCVNLYCAMRSAPVLPCLRKRFVLPFPLFRYRQRGKLRDATL